MSDKQPKPFHIGTRVRWAFYVMPIGTVKFAEDNVVFVRNDDDNQTRAYYKDSFVHADDGSPLGEWVPINPKTEYAHESVLGPRVSPLISVSSANSIIRGEVGQ